MARISIAAALAPSQAERSFELEWTAPEGCPSGREVTTKIETYLASSAASRSTDPIRATANVAVDDTGYTLALHIEGRPGTREVTASGCRELADAAAFIVSLAVDPTLRLEPPGDPVDDTTSEPDSGGKPESGPAPAPAPAPAEVDSHSGGEPIDRPRRGLVLRVDGGPGYGALPRLGGSVGLMLGAELERARVELVGRYAFPQAARLETEPSAGARISVGMVSVRGCWVPRAGRVGFPVCGGPAVGAVRATGIGVEDARTEHRVWSGLDLAPGLTVAVGPIALWAALELTTLFVRPRFLIEGAGTVHRLGPVHGRALLGIELHWPATKSDRSGK